MDVFMNPTAELADIVLPAALWPEVDCLFCMPEFADRVLLSQRKCVQVGECKSDEEFILELCRRAGWNYGYTSQSAMLEGQIREMIRRRPELSGITVEEIQNRGYLEPERAYENYKTRGFQTPTGKFEFWSTAMEQAGVDPLPSWQEPPETPMSNPALSAEYPLILTTGGRQQPYFVSNNRQIRSLRKLEPFPIVTLHPATAAKYGIGEGDWVWIENQRGKITQKAHLDSGIAPDVINAQFGWWYPEAGPPEYGWRESNANMLTAAAPPYDHYLGSYQLRGLLCRVYPNPDCTIEQRYEQWMRQSETDALQI